MKAVGVQLENYDSCNFDIDAAGVSQTVGGKGKAGWKDKIQFESFITAARSVASPSAGKATTTITFAIMHHHHTHPLCDGPSPCSLNEMETALSVCILVLTARYQYHRHLLTLTHATYGHNPSIAEVWLALSRCSSVAVRTVATEGVSSKTTASLHWLRSHHRLWASIDISMSWKTKLRAALPSLVYCGTRHAIESPVTPEELDCASANVCPGPIPSTIALPFVDFA